MHKFFHHIVLMFGLLFYTLSASGADDGNVGIKPIKIIEPKDKHRVIKDAAIDTESFEIGAFAGFIAVEDFSANAVFGVSGAYHFLDRMLLIASYGQSEVEKATFEELADGSFLTDEDRKLKYYDVQFGYNLFPGRSFSGVSRNFNSGIYLLAGVGNSEFAGDTNFTFIIGSSYRMVVTDWLTWNIDFRDRIFNRDFLDDKKTTHNIEFSSGLNYLF